MASSTQVAGKRHQENVDFADSLDEARRRFDLYKSDDPFPEIPPALLNSADIADYVGATGMIYPFDFGNGLKSASYAVPLLGEAVFWDEKKKMRAQDIRQGDVFTLQRNSIAFVTLEPEFHLPDYIALRFNLKIPNVYKGLLLGTGPLVDPGWEGTLSFPLHNLTTNEYVFRGGEPLIWMEFTKLSPNSRWGERASNAIARRGDYVSFPEEKKFGTVRSRLESAAPNMPVTSSLADALSEAEEAASTARRLSNYIQWGGAIALIFGLATIVALAVDVLFLQKDHQAPATTTPVVVVQGPDARSLERQVRQLQTRIAALERRRTTQP